jgi:hypothetical protein
MYKARFIKNPFLSQRTVFQSNLVKVNSSVVAPEPCQAASFCLTLLSDSFPHNIQAFPLYYTEKMCLNALPDCFKRVSFGESYFQGIDKAFLFYY